MSEGSMSLQKFVFFFQAEDGIRDLTVTGVQTCALPISQAGARCQRCTNRFPSRKSRRPAPSLVGPRTTLLSHTEFAPAPHARPSTFPNGAGGPSLLRAISSSGPDRKSTRLNSSHSQISYAVFCLKKKNSQRPTHQRQSLV